MTASIWHGELARLDRLLPELGLARSRSQAFEAIAAGRVRVDGVTAVKAGQRVAAGSSIEVDGLDHYVSRAAHKLVAGLDAFGVDPGGMLALDVGASTGGFTQVLLERGAREVLAIDVGHGQLAESLRADGRVRVVEGCNARDLTPQALAELTGADEAPEIVVADISFISLDLVLPALACVASPGASFVLLIKPQFEVGRTGISGGIVIDAALAAAAVARVIENAAKTGLECKAVAASPITGEHGNREVLAHFVLGLDGSLSEKPCDPTEWNERILEALDHGGEA